MSLLLLTAMLLVVAAIAYEPFLAFLVFYVAPLAIGVAFARYGLPDGWTGLKFFFGLLAFVPFVNRGSAIAAVIITVIEVLWHVMPVLVGA